MAITQRETGWKPEFGLGAYIAGENAADADFSNQEELVKQFLANQREQQMQPLDLDVRRQEAQLARSKMNDPEYTKWLLEMTKGQGKSMGAAGDLAQATSPLRINNEKQNLETSNLMGNLMKRLAQLKQGAGTQGGTIGFNMQQQPQQQAPQQGFSWQVSPQQQQSRDQDALAIVEQEAAANPNDPALQRQLMMMRQKTQSRGPSQTLNSNNPEYEQVMQSLMDTPEFRQKMMQQDQRLDSNEYMKQLGLLQAMRVAQENAKGRGLTKPPKDAEEAMVRDLNNRYATGGMSQEEYMVELAGIFNRKTNKQEISGVTGTVGPTGDISLTNKPNAPTYVPGAGNKEEKPDPLGIR